jgi:hypothetical protein
MLGLTLLEHLQPIVLTYLGRATPLFVQPTGSENYLDVDPTTAARRDKDEKPH